MLSNDGWAPIYYDHYRATNAIACSIYFFTLIIVGRFIILNLFIAILIDNFDQLSIRNDFFYKIRNITQKSFYKRLIAILKCKRKKRRIAPSTFTTIDDLINKDMQE